MKSLTKSKKQKLVAVGEAQMVELERALDPPELASPWRVANLRLGVEDGRDLDHRRRGRLQHPVDIGKLLQRLEDELHQVDGGQQRPNLE